MKKIYICQATGTENKSFVSAAVPYLLIFFAILFISVKNGLIDIGNEIIDTTQQMYMLGGPFSIWLVYYSSYKLTPPYLQIDSLHNLLIYIGRQVQYSTKLKNIHNFSIVDDGIILHSDKIIKIPFSEFKEVDLIGFANAMKKVIATNTNFYTILNKDNQIAGFNYLEGNTMEQIREQGTMLTHLWWWSHSFPVISIVAISIMASITELAMWFFKLI